VVIPQTNLDVPVHEVLVLLLHEAVFVQSALFSSSEAATAIQANSR
jgi:hypothetical protein